MSAAELRRAAALIDQLETGAFQGAVADWLDAEAEGTAECGASEWEAGVVPLSSRHALAVARAYLAEDL